MSVLNHQNQYFLPLNQFEKFIHGLEGHVFAFSLLPEFSLLKSYVFTLPSKDCKKKMYLRIETFMSCWAHTYVYVHVCL